MTANLRLGCFVALALLVATTACASSEQTASESDDIVGGEDAFDKPLDAVARLSTPSGSFCTATLVAPQLVVTAAHCVEGFDGMGRERPISATFTKYDRNGGVVSERELEGSVVLRFGAEKRPDGSSRFGIDIAIVMLKNAVPREVAVPIAVRAKTLGEGDVGKSFTIVGYGQTKSLGEASPNQPRQMGEVRLNAVSGKPFEKVFGAREAFDAYLTKIEDADFAAKEGARIFAQELSVYGNEVHVGGEIGGPQGCFGDSGGPLLQKTGDRYELVAVASNGPAGRKNACIAGEMFVRADAHVIEAVAARAARPDPWALVPCSDAPGVVASCGDAGQVVSCQRFTHLPGSRITHKQRIESCGDRDLVCMGAGADASCK